MTETGIPSHTPPADPPPAAGTPPADPKKFSEFVPEEYRDRPYLKDLMALDEGPEAVNALFKKFDGAQKLIGKKTGAPAPEAPIEEWQEFYKSLAPESADKYEIKVGEGKEVPKEHIERVQKIFHDAKLQPWQAKILQEQFGSIASEEGSAREAEIKQLDADFEKMTTEVFADKKDEILKRVNGMLKEHTPEVAQNLVQNLPNESLVVLAAVLNSVHDKYISEDDLSGGTVPTGGDSSELRDEGRKLMGSEAYKDAFHPKHEEVKARVQQVYADIAKADSRK